jgi:hypothetical protein
MSKCALALGLVVFAWGCSDDSGMVTCTDELRSSVRLTVLDPEGQPVTDADVSYSVDGAEAKPCAAADVSYTCGLEEEGRFVITAERGGESGVARVNVRADVCHVDPEDVTLPLETSS